MNILTREEHKKHCQTAIRYYKLVIKQHPEFKEYYLNQIMKFNEKLKKIYFSH